MVSDHVFNAIHTWLSVSLTTSVDIFNVGTFAAFFSAAVFVVGYSVLAPWWRYKIGWSVILLDITLILVLLPRVLQLLFNLNTSGLFFTWYRCLSLFAVAAVTVWRLALVYQAQREMLHDVASAVSRPGDNQKEESG